MASEKEILPGLFRTEYSRIVAVLGKLFGLEHIEIAEDLVSDAFLLAAETWGQKGIPANPAAWLYTVSKNKTRDYLRRNQIFLLKIREALTLGAEGSEELSIDLSDQNIQDSQLQMMFALCHPCLSFEAQVSLSLRILCGFGIEEIASAFFSNKETIQKRLLRSKEKLRSLDVKIECPPAREIHSRLASVLTTLYLLFNEGYYSLSHDSKVRKDLCNEAMRLTLILIHSDLVEKSDVNALLALMCFHASRFDARTNSDGLAILYHQQDRTLWDQELTQRGAFYLTEAARGGAISKFQLEAAIAYWHTVDSDDPEKWRRVLGLYDLLQQIEFSPVVTLNRLFAYSKVFGKEAALAKALDSDLPESSSYYNLMGYLFTGVDRVQALHHYKKAFSLSRSENEKRIIMLQVRDLEA